MKAFQLLLLLLTAVTFTEELFVAETNDSSWSGDSLFWASRGQYTYKDGKTEYYYNSQLDTEGDTFKTYQRQVFSHSDKQIQNTIQHWSEENKEWFDSSQLVFKYDENENWIGYTSYNKVDGQWKKTLVWVREYDSKGRNTLDTISYYDNNEELYSGQIWKNTYTGDNLTEDLTLLFVEGAWTNSNRKRFSFDGSFKTEEVYETWVDNSWIKNTKESFTKEGVTVTSILAYWEADTLKKDEKSVSILNAAGLDSLVEIWDYTSDGEWKKRTRTTTKYNNSKKLTDELIEIWDSVAFVNKSKTVIEYTQDTLISSNRSYSWRDSEWKKSRVSYTSHKLLKQIEAVVNTLFATDSNRVQLFNNQLFAPESAQTLQVFTMQGRLVAMLEGMQMGSRSAFQLPSNLAKSMYILQVKDKENKRLSAPILHQF